MADKPVILMPEDKHMTIANVAVHPLFQGNGLGRGLMKFGEEEARLSLILIPQP